jgi:hypothetical protein
MNKKTSSIEISQNEMRDKMVSLKHSNIQDKWAKKKVLIIVTCELVAM